MFHSCSSSRAHIPPFFCELSWLHTMLVSFFPSHYFPSFTQSLALSSPSALFGSSVHILQCVSIPHIQFIFFHFAFQQCIVILSYLLHVLCSYFSFIHVNILHFYCLLWAFHSSFSLTSCVFLAHAFSLLSCIH